MSVISTEFQGFNSFTPVIPSGPTAGFMSAPGSADSDDSSSSSKKSGKTQLTSALDSDMIKFLMEKGLSSDVEAFMTLMEGVIDRAYDPITGKINVAAYKLMLPRLAKIKQEKELFDEAMKEVRSNKGLDEIAVTTRGEVYVVDPELGLITKHASLITAEDRALTNGELANMRASNTLAAFNFDITSTIANGIGTLKITEYLLDTISKLGKTTTSLDLYMDENGLFVEGAAILNLMLLEKKGSLKVSTTTESLQEQAMMALNYIASTLPSNMQAILLVKAVLSGLSVDNIVKSLVFSNVSQKVDLQISVSSPSSTSNSNDLDSLPTDPSVRFAMGIAPTTKHTINLGNNLLYEGTVRIHNLPGKDGGNLQPGSTLLDVLGGKFKGSLDTHNMTFGDAKIENPDAVKILDSQVLDMELPIDSRAEGVVRPDMARLSIMEQLNKNIRDQHITDTATINEMYKSAGLPPLFNADGSKNTGDYARFALIQGYVGEQAFDDVTVMFNNSVQRVNDENKLELLKRLTPKGAVDITDGEVHSGTIFIPIISAEHGYSNSILGAYQGSGSSLTGALTNLLVGAQAQTDRAKQLGYRPPKPLSSYQQ